MNPSFSARSVVEELDVKERVNILCKGHSRFSEVFEGIKWLLARSGDNLGQTVSSEHKGRHFRLYKAELSAVDGLSEMKVVYEITSEEVVLIKLDAV